MQQRDRTAKLGLCRGPQVPASLRCMRQNINRRPRLQFHLSTSVVLMLFAGGFVALNCIPNPNFQWRDPAWISHNQRVDYYGWPACFVKELYEPFKPRPGSSEIEFKKSRPLRFQVWPGLVINTSLLVLGAWLIAARLEARIRKAEIDHSNLEPKQ